MKLRYDSPRLEHPLVRTSIYEKIIIRLLETMEDLKEIEVSDNGTHVAISGKGKNTLDKYDKEISRRLPFIIKHKKFKRYTQAETEQGYRELLRITDELLSCK